MSGLFVWSDPEEDQILFSHHMYVTVVVSFEIDVAVFAVVDIDGVVAFVLLIVTAIETG